MRITVEGAARIEAALRRIANEFRREVRLEIERAAREEAYGMGKVRRPAEKLRGPQRPKPKKRKGQR